MTSADDVARVFREDAARAVAILVRALGDVQSAEDAVQEAFAAALARWPVDGLPPRPAGWIVTTARNKAIDRLRRESSRDARQREAALLHALGDTGPDDGFPDERLRLVFTCCHPALARPAQVALTLRLVGGLQTAEIARAFLVSETAMAQRLVRAKRKITAATIPFRVPTREELPTRLRSVLAVVYLIFAEGHLATEGDAVQRRELTAEAVRLARLVARLLPDEPEATGLLALLLLTEARSGARSRRGRPVRLADQDRSRWDAAAIEEGHRLVRACLRRNEPGPYQLQAAIAAVHTDAPSVEATDWTQVVALYDHLLRLTPTPVVAMHRAIAVAEVEGPAVALALLDGLDLGGHHLWHAARGEMLLRLHRDAEARQAFGEAHAGTRNGAERRLLEDRMAAIGAVDG